MANKINSSKSLYKFTDFSRSKKNKAPEMINYDLNNLFNENETISSKKKKNSNNVNYPKMSNFYEIYHSDSEGSELIILPQNISLPSFSSDSDLDIDNNPRVTNYKASFVTSTPLNENENKYFFEQKSQKAPSAHHTPNEFDKFLSPIHSKKLLTENQENKLVNSKYSVKPNPEINLNNVKKDVINIKRSLVTFQHRGSTKNMSLCKENANNEHKLNVLSSEILNKTNSIEELLKGSNHVYSFSNICTFKNDNEKNQECVETDLSELFQMELSLKMFDGNVVPHLNSLKHDMLQLMDISKCKTIKQSVNSSKNINDIIKNVSNTMSLSLNNTFVDNKRNNHNNLPVPFVDIDFDTLNVFSNKLEYLDKLLKQVKFKKNVEVLETQLKDENYLKKLDTKSNDLSETNNLSNSIENLKSLESIEDINDNVISLTKTEASDSSQQFRNLNKSNTLLPINNTFVLNESSLEKSLYNHSLSHEVGSFNHEVLEVKTLNINSSYKESNIHSLARPNKSNYSYSQKENVNDKKEGGNESRYWLRKFPEATKHFFVPYKPTTCRRKISGFKKKYNDVFICKGTNKNKTILQYKVHSVLNSNSSELMVNLGLENKNKNNNSNQNNTHFDISKLKPRKNDKPCQCGIFPSQVPSYWNNTLHESLHQNLHKLQLKRGIPREVAGKINDNGFLYDIIRINVNGDNDRSLKLMLKNVQDFILLELGFTKKNINKLSHSILLALTPNFKVIGYLETESLNNACIYRNNQLSENLVPVKFGVTKLWVMVKYRNCGVATKLVNKFCDLENLETNDIAFAYHGSHGISFIKKYFAKNSVLIY